MTLGDVETPVMGLAGMGVRAVHFVGFRGDEYLSAVRVFGKPDFIHMGWDRRARRDIDMDNDVIVFAKGPHDQPVAERNFDDLKEPPRNPS